MPPILYSFRRCPYAIRARLAIAVSEQSVRLREIILKDKPAELLAISPEKTIPVLQFNDAQATVITESLEIMIWALNENDPQQWLAPPMTEMLALIDCNDYEFKPWLDKYKYADRFPAYSEHYYRDRADDFLMQLETRLLATPYLFGSQISLADMAIFPFIRQFASVDTTWFEQSHYLRVKQWLATLLGSPLFVTCMEKYPTWLTSKEDISFPA